MCGFLRTRLDLEHECTYVAKPKEGRGDAFATSKDFLTTNNLNSTIFTCILALIYVKSPLFVAEAQFLG